MKRIIKLLVLILVITLIMILPIQAADFDLVSDGVGVLTDDEYFELNELAMNITEQYKFEVSIVVIDDKGDEEATEYASFIYDEYGYGYGENKSGLMLFISMKERDYAIIAQGYGNIAFTDYGKDVLTDKYLLPQLGKDEYYEGFLMYLNQTAEFLKMAENGTPFDVETNEVFAEEDAKSSFGIKLAVTIIVPMLIAGLICFIFVGQMKTAVPQQSADNYIAHGSFNLTNKVDKFLYETETRTQIKEKTPSGGTSTGSNNSSSGKGKF